MSMCLGLVTLSDANIARVLRDPPLVLQVLAPDDPEAYEEARAAQSAPGLLAKLLGRRREPDPDLVLSPAEGVSADLDKAWHGIHYLLTGTAYQGDHPHNFLVSGGQMVGDLDVGYGPARVLTSTETREAKHALDALRDEDLRARFDPEDMMQKEIYPEIWTRPPEQDDTLGYLMEYVQTLRACLDRATGDGLGVVVTLG